MKNEQPGLGLGLLILRMHGVKIIVGLHGKSSFTIFETTLYFSHL